MSKSFTPSGRRSSSKALITAGGEPTKLYDPSHPMADKDGNVFWNTALVPTQEALLDRIKAIAVLDPQPEIVVDLTPELVLGEHQSGGDRHADGGAAPAPLHERAGPPPRAPGPAPGRGIRPAEHRRLRIRQWVT